MDKSLGDIQREVDAYISQFKEGYFSPLSMLARMSEEVGELAREVNHQFGEKPKKADEADNSIGGAGRHSLHYRLFRQFTRYRLN